MVGARCVCPISGAKHRAPTIETIVLMTFYEITFFEEIQFRYQFSGLKKRVTALVEARAPGRNAPEASVGLTLGHENPSVFPPKEAGGVFPAPSTQKSAPHDSKRATQTPGPWVPLAVTPRLFPK